MLTPAFSYQWANYIVSAKITTSTTPNQIIILSMAFTNTRYKILRDLFKSQRLPLAFVDLDAFDFNVDVAAALAKKADKTLRLGTKSLRCLPLMERVLAHASSAFRGFLTFTSEATAFPAQNGHNDFLLAYPTVHRLRSAR